MLSQRDRDRLGHMIDHAREAVALAHGKTRTDLDSDRVLNLALGTIAGDRARGCWPGLTRGVCTAP